MRNEWAPEHIRAVPSSRRAGFAWTLFEALRGIPEQHDGQPLSERQVEALAPFLSEAYRLPTAVVTAALRDVRIYVGGAAADRGGQTVALGCDLYVIEGSTVARILSWEGRRLLAHELGHTMQYLRGKEGRVPAFRGPVGKMRSSALRYAWAVVWGALMRGSVKWVADRIRRRSGRQGFVDDVHDRHRLEIEAEYHAQAFVRPASGKPGQDA